MLFKKLIININGYNTQTTPNFERYIVQSSDYYENASGQASLAHPRNTTQYQIIEGRVWHLARNINIF